tara:strand:- start:49 stop:204 length:156 start_codon:yes stop_codon:yes gene_type:complete
MPKSMVTAQREAVLTDIAGGTRIARKSAKRSEGRQQRDMTPTVMKKESFTR